MYAIFELIRPIRLLRVMGAVQQLTASYIWRKPVRDEECDGEGDKEEEIEDKDEDD